MAVRFLSQWAFIAACHGGITFGLDQSVRGLAEPQGDFELGPMSLEVLACFFFFSCHVDNFPASAQERKAHVTV